MVMQSPGAHPGLSHDPNCPLFQAVLGMGFPSEYGGLLGWSAWASEHFKACSGLADLGLMSSRPDPSTKALPHGPHAGAVFANSAPHCPRVPSEVSRAGLVCPFYR